MSEETVIPRGKSVRTLADRDSGTRATRVRGVFNGTRAKLGVLDEIPGFHLHWINDDEGRVERAQQGGYDFVNKGEVQLENVTVIEPNADIGSRICTRVGSRESGDGIFAYLMKQRQEWYDEDQAELAEKVRISQEALVAEGGKDAAGIGNKYIPKGQKSALEFGNKK